MGRTLKVFHPDTEAPGKLLNLPSRALGLTVAPPSFEDLSRRRQPDSAPQTSECHEPLCATISISGSRKKKKKRCTRAFRIHGTNGMGADHGQQPEPLPCRSAHTGSRRPQPRTALRSSGIAFRHLQLPWMFQCNYHSGTNTWICCAASRFLERALSGRRHPSARGPGHGASAQAPTASA